MGNAKSSSRGIFMGIFMWEYQSGQLGELGHIRIEPFFFFFLVDSRECVDQFTRISINSLSGSSKSRSFIPALKNSRENTFLRPDPKNYTLINCVESKLPTNRTNFWDYMDGIG